MKESQKLVNAFLQNTRAGLLEEQQDKPVTLARLIDALALKTGEGHVTYNKAMRKRASAMRTMMTHLASLRSTQTETYDISGAPCFVIPQKEGVEITGRELKNEAANSADVDHGLQLLVSRALKTKRLADALAVADSLIATNRPGDQQGNHHIG